MDQCLSALCLIEFLGLFGGVSACFEVVLHLKVVCVITFDFCGSIYDYGEPMSNHLYVCEVC